MSAAHVHTWEEMDSMGLTGIDLYECTCGATMSVELEHDGSTHTVIQEPADDDEDEVMARPIAERQPLED